MNKCCDDSHPSSHNGRSACHHVKGNAVIKTIEPSL